MRFGLERMRRLMTALDSPHERFASIHVVGTNGKSSTARMIAAMLERHGLRTGAYLSPHLTSFAERVEVDERGRLAGALRGRVAAGRAGGRARRPDARRRGRVTQFEALTAAAYWELARAGVEAAVVEAGLGGRYDATSVIDSTRAGADQRGARAHALARADASATSPRRSWPSCGRGGTLVTGPLGRRRSRSRSA